MAWIWLTDRRQIFLVKKEGQTLTVGRVVSAKLSPPECDLALFLFKNKFNEDYADILFGGLYRIVHAHGPNYSEKQADEQQPKYSSKYNVYRQEYAYYYPKPSGKSVNGELGSSNSVEEAKGNEEALISHNQQAKLGSFEGRHVQPVFHILDATMIGTLHQLGETWQFQKLTASVKSLRRMSVINTKPNDLKPSKPALEENAIYPYIKPCV